MSSEKLKSVMKNLVDANAQLAQDHRTISRVFAVAFLSAPGETIRSGVALAVAGERLVPFETAPRDPPKTDRAHARGSLTLSLVPHFRAPANKRSYELASSDQIRSREVADLAGARSHAHKLPLHRVALTRTPFLTFVPTLTGTQQLIVAGCLRAIRRATIMDALLSSHDGAIALRNAIFGECRVIISLPGASGSEPMCHVLTSHVCIWIWRPVAPVAYTSSPFACRHSELLRGSLEGSRLRPLGTNFLCEAKRFEHQVAAVVAALLPSCLHRRSRDL